MSIKRITLLAAAGLLTVSLGAGVVAQDNTVAANAMAPAAEGADAFVPPATPEEAVAARKALMRSNGATLRDAGALTGAEAVAAMQTLYDNYSHIPPLFPEGSITADSKALPVIWEQWEEFVAIAEAGQAAAQQGLTAAEAGDAAGYAAALQTIGGTCGQCHTQFRAQ